MKINMIARRRARKAGKKYYRTGTPCRNGHDALRLTINGRCVLCQRQFDEMYGRKPEIREKIRAKTKIRHYNLSSDQFKLLMKNQNEKCATCGLSFGLSRDDCPHVDHNHSTNKVRGLLCGKCNVALGYAKENINTLKAMIKYLKKYA